MKNRKKLILVILMVFPLYFLSAEDPIENINRVCTMCPDREIISFLKARGISEEMLSRPVETLYSREVEVIAHVCCKAGNELCCLIKSRMAEKLRYGYDLVVLQIGAEKWSLDKYGNFIKLSA